MTLNSQLPAWSALGAHARTVGTASLRDLVAADRTRWEHLHFEFGDWLLDLSRQRITPETLGLLFSLSRAVGLTEKIEAMFRGDTINGTLKQRGFAMKLVFERSVANPSPPRARTRSELEGKQ